MPCPSKRSRAAKKIQADLRSTKMPADVAESGQTTVDRDTEVLPPLPRKNKARAEVLPALPRKKKASAPQSSDANYAPVLFPYCSRTAQTQPNSAETLLKLSQTADSLNMCHDSANPLSNTLTSNATNDCLIESVDFPERSVLMGSFHQGDSRFGNVRNKQCGAISLTAVLKSKMKNVWSWETRDLDDVLIKGTVLYRSMSAQGKIRDQGRGYIAVSELPRQYEVWNCDFSINFADSYTGFIQVDDYDDALRDVAMPFDVALQRALFSNDASLQI
ncbi:uncharacterized protein LOC121696166 [Alosa sapidissima]|uniref:uncharacterized protein LOC121696166 n=1 Tax=Alosa sapidissima TaxID=34773 RepID=UPI001C09C28A|nr:uncharacterized protein LOC121696166 [Alosa sapidissima]